MRCSALALAWNAVTGQAYWKPAWRDAAPRETYDVVIVGGGAHGLATTYYLAKEHGIANVAVLEKSWIGSGNAGRNTTIIRSNYLLPGNIPFYEWSMKLWEGLEQDLNYNTMVSQRGVLNLYHSDLQRDAFARRGNAMRLHGVCATPSLPLPPPPPFGAMRAPPIGAASTSCRTARSPAFAFQMDAWSGSTLRAVPFVPTRWRSLLPAQAPGLLPWPACVCRSKATCCRLSSPRV